MRIQTSGKIQAGQYGFMVRNGNSWNIYDSPLEGENINTASQIASLPNTGKAQVLTRNQYRLLGLEDGTARIIRFADLHRHSDNSLQDGMTKVKDMVKATEYAGALTDHGNMYGYLEYYNAMNAAGKKPIIGFEGYIENLDGKLEGRHIILLAKTTEGYHNLLKLTSESFEHFYKKPHVTWDMLRKYHEGVICLTACLAGSVAHELAEGHEDKAKEIIESFISIFGKEDLYIEIQKHNIKQEELVRPQLIRLAKEYGLKVVATTDAHYLSKEDKEAHEVLLCLQTGTTMSDETRMRYDGEGYYLFNSEMMEEWFAEYPEALDNTLEIAEKCNIEIRQGDVNMPRYSYPAPFHNAEEYMKHLAEEGFRTRFAGTDKENDPVYLERFKYEYDMIVQMGFASYFIIVWDFINYARSHDIFVGPGRGSAAGSLIAYCLSITDLDPIHYNLLFERFLNPERVSMPDVDVDLQHTGREQVIQYLINKYGEQNVCRIVTFGTFAAKQSVKDVARVLDYPASFGASLAKLIPAAPGMTIEKAMQESPEFKSAYESNSDTKRVVDIAKKIEGGKRHASQHACGCCLSPNPVSDYMPTSMEKDDAGNAALCTQVVMTEVEPLSLIKMDLLGLKNLSVIHEVEDAVVRDFGIESVLKEVGIKGETFHYSQIPMTDRATYRMLKKGITGGVFQLESPGMTKLIQQMFEDLDSIPDNQLEQCFERLIAAVALYRPGPMDYIPNYLEGMRNPEKIHYLDQRLYDILKPTYGVIVYQEQVMQIVRELGGFSMGRSDIVRKAMGKKKKAVMDAEKAVFIYGNENAIKAGKKEKPVPGCIKNGIPESVAKEIWHQMETFASYAFNRSHAACYAYIGYITAYMSCHWPTQFYAAMLNAFIENSDKVKSYLAQASERNIRLLLPDLNISDCMYSADGNNIRCGLKGISGIKNIASSIVEERNKNGRFNSYQNFYERMSGIGHSVNKKCSDGLIYSGALNSFSENKGAMLKHAETIEREYKKRKPELEMGQITLFSADELKIEIDNSVSELNTEALMEKEEEMLGMYVSRHPVDIAISQIKPGQPFMPLERVTEFAGSNKEITTLGMIKDIKRIYTKKDQKEMCSFTIETAYTKIKAIIFPKHFIGENKELKENYVYRFTGTINQDNVQEGAFQMIVRSVKLVLRYPFACNEPPYRAQVESMAQQEIIKSFIKSHPGNHVVLMEHNGIFYPHRDMVETSKESEDFFKKLENGNWHNEEASKNENSERQIF